MGHRPVEEDGQLHTLGLIEELLAECKQMWGTSSELYFRIDELLRELANPNLHEIFSTSAYQVVGPLRSAYSLGGRRRRVDYDSARCV
jgi:hypothetical protein